MDDTKNNIAETVAREARKPVVMEINGLKVLALPDGYKTEDLDKLMPAPRRKIANVTLGDTDSFIDYTKRHGSLDTATVWCDAAFREGKVKLTAILNDHGETATEPHWRDHIANYTPTFATEWTRWFTKDKQQFSQPDFAAFIEENIRDIAGDGDTSASGAQMLEMALNFEANQDLRFKSAMRLQNGAVQISFAENDDAQTLTKMQMFDKFGIGIPVFWGGQAYAIEARLRYRARDGKVVFWFELIRPDKVLEDAAKGLVEQVKTGTGLPLFYGHPFAR